MYKIIDYEYDQFQKLIDFLIFISEYKVIMRDNQIYNDRSKKPPPRFLFDENRGNQEVLDKERSELDRYVNPVNESCGRIHELSDRLVLAYPKAMYRTLEIISNDMIKEIDRFINVSRRLRGKLRRIGFMRLRKLDRTQELTLLLIKTDGIHGLLVQIEQTDYTRIYHTFFCDYMIRGEIVLKNYIDKLEGLQHANIKWLDKFFM